MQAGAPSPDPLKRGGRSADAQAGKEAIYGTGSGGRRESWGNTMQEPMRGPVELPADVAERLGLGETPVSVRPLSRTRRTLLVERIGSEASPVPWDRDLVLSADVRAFSVADVLQMVHASGKSGFLHFEHADCEKSVYLHAGEVVFASSNQRIDRIGVSLVRSGVLSLADQQAASEAYHPPQQFGRFLVDRGLLTPRQLWEGVKAQVEDIVRSLFAYGAGQVFLWEGEVRPDNVVRLALPTGRLIEEGLWHRDELLVFLAQLESSQVRLQKVAEVTTGLDGTAGGIIRALESVDTFPAVCHEVGIDPLSGARTVQLLDQLGALRLVREKAEGVVNGSAPSGEEELRECVRNHVKLLAELSAPVVAVEGPEPVRERLADVARQAAERHPQLLDDLEMGPGGVLDPEVLIERALCFPGDREREVRSALGELVSYVEFELLNHPQVSDAEIFLEAVEPIRAQL